jgi:hypothetical protein
MQLPTDPSSIAELETLMREAEAARQRWLEATERVHNWLVERADRCDIGTRPTVGTPRNVVE